MDGIVDEDRWYYGWYFDRFSTDCSISEYKNNIKSFLLLNEISVNT